MKLRVSSARATVSGALTSTPTRSLAGGPYTERRTASLLWARSAARSRVITASAAISPATGSTMVSAIAATMKARPTAVFGRDGGRLSRGSRWSRGAAGSRGSRWPGAAGLGPCGPHGPGAPARPGWPAGRGRGGVAGDRGGRHVERAGVGAEPAGRRPVRGVPGQRGRDQRDQRRGDAGQVGAAGDDAVEDRLVGAAAERQAAGGRERHRRAPGVHVRGGAARLALDHLGGEVS